MESKIKKKMVMPQRTINGGCFEIMSLISCGLLVWDAASGSISGMDCMG
jgi:hypothetical protein